MRYNGQVISLLELLYSVVRVIQKRSIFYSY